MIVNSQGLSNWLSSTWALSCSFLFDKSILYIEFFKCFICIFKWWKITQHYQTFSNLFLPVAHCTKLHMPCHFYFWPCPCYSLLQGLGNSFTGELHKPNSYSLLQGLGNSFTGELHKPNSYSLLQGLGNSFTGELHKPNSRCFSRVSAYSIL